MGREERTSAAEAVKRRAVCGTAEAVPFVESLSEPPTAGYQGLVAIRGEGAGTVDFSGVPARLFHGKGQHNTASWTRVPIPRFQ
jgi:hypothetical protein